MDHIMKEKGITSMTQSQLHSLRTFIEAGVTSLLRPIRAFLTKEVAGLCARALALMSMCVLLGSALVAQGTPMAFAVQAKPVTAWSYYVNSSSTSTAYTLGCNQGKSDKTYHQNSAAFLDFGGQLSNGSGTLLLNGSTISNGHIEAVAEAMAHGYWVCTGSDSTTVLRIGIGTNNSYYDVSYGGGQTWSNVVTAAENSIKISGYSSQVIMYGANDIEPSWSSASAAIAWANGFGSVGGHHYFNYGSADGCPQYSTGNGGCNNGWNQYDVYYVSWGANPAQGTPEIYYSSQARQWAMIDLYAHQTQGGMYIEGPLDEHDLNTSTFTAQGAWNALWTDLYNARISQNFPYSLEVHRE